MAAIYNERPLSMYDNLHVTHTAKDTFNTNTMALHEHFTNGKIELQQEGQSTANAFDEKCKNLANAEKNEGNLKVKVLKTLRQNHDSYNEISTPTTTTINIINPSAITTAEIPEKLKSSSPSPSPLSTPINFTALVSKLHEKPVIVTNAITTPSKKAATASIIIPTNRLSRNQTSSAVFDGEQTISELKETGQSIAIVKAALNEAKSKFFGLNNHYIEQSNQQQKNHQQHQQRLSRSATSLYFDEICEIGNILEENSCINEMQQQQRQQQQQQNEMNIKIKPKYQNIPENSAIYRTHYQQQQQQFSSSPNALHELNTHNKIIGINDIVKEKSPTTLATPTSAAITVATATATTTHKELLLNDIDNNMQQPSQAVYMATTVPQNIKGSKIAGRHTPTRNSLRHSRMLVINNKNYKDASHSSTINFSHIRLIRWLIILQIIIASALIALAMWQFLLAPNTSIYDNTYWSALVLLFAGILNLNLIRYERINNKHYKRQRRDHCFKFLHINSYVLSLLAIFLCIAALILAALHYGRLSAKDTKCESSNILLEQGSCTCTFHFIDHLNDTQNATLLLLLADTNNTVHNNNQNQYDQFEYRDLSCQEVTGVWLTILTYSIVLNSIGALITIIYLILLMYYRYNNKTKYNSIPTNL